MDDESPEVFARHLVVCQNVTYDPSEYGAGYSLENVYEMVHPTDDLEYPLVLERVCLFAQLFGTPGTYQFRIQLVRIDGVSEQETVIATHGPWAGVVRGTRFVSSVTFVLWKVEMPESGLYEFRLYQNGRAEPIVGERILARE